MSGSRLSLSLCVCVCWAADCDASTTSPEAEASPLASGAPARQKGAVARQPHCPVREAAMAAVRSARGRRRGAATGVSLGARTGV
eukprot:scaffold9941_cov116-Isochrysis_galbana.AAC.3